MWIDFSTLILQNLIQIMCLGNSNAHGNKVFSELETNIVKSAEHWTVSTRDHSFQSKTTTVHILHKHWFTDLIVATQNIRLQWFLQVGTSRFYCMQTFSFSYSTKVFFITIKKELMMHMPNTLQHIYLYVLAFWLIVS